MGDYTKRLIEALLMKSTNSILRKNFEALLKPSEKGQEDNPDKLTIKDDSLPLVCTYDKFLKLIEDTAIAMDRQNFSDVKAVSDKSNDQLSIGSSQKDQPKLIDFRTFRLEIWPRLPHSFTKDLPVHLVFAEIMGVIKGSESSRQSLKPLSREEYMKRSSRLAPSFKSESERPRVYDLFERYEALKRLSGDFDYIDRVVKLLDTIRRDRPLRDELQSRFDEIYVDEIQDQRCLDIELFFSIIRDGRGFHFAGDTAQAISNESTFRFEDVKKMMYDHFARTANSNRQLQLSQPETFLLSKNYRSHRGILALASLVMKMIWDGFPATVDKLQPEIGSLNGPKAVLFFGCNEDILLSSGDDSDQLFQQPSDFGAEQVILVRDSETKAELRQKIGNGPIILTILESKGMEFDDVILWAFFSGCPNQPGVRRLIMLRSEPSLFDPDKNTEMCLELKSFYVAVTRARTQLFIVEPNEGTAATVRQLLTDDLPEPVVEVTGPSYQDFAVRIGMMRSRRSSSPEDWNRQADELMDRGYFKEAILAYRNARNDRGTTIAEGYMKLEEGQACRSKNNEEEFRMKFDAAFINFKDAGLVSEAASILIQLHRLSDAAELWLKNGNHDKAADLFARADLYSNAFQCYDAALQREEAASMLQKQRLYDDLVSYVANNTTAMSAGTIQSYGTLCKLLLKQNKLSHVNRGHAIKLLGSLQDQEDCFVAYGMDEELDLLYTEQRKYKESFRLQLRTGQLQKALDIALHTDLLQVHASEVEEEMLLLLDYLWAEQWTQGSPRSFAEEMSHATLSPKMHAKCREWVAIRSVYNSKAAEGRKDYKLLDSTMAQIFLGARMVIDPRFITHIPHYDALPFEMLQDMVTFAKRLIFEENVLDWMPLLLPLGFYKSADNPERYIKLPWSPLDENDGGAKEIKRAARRRLLDGIASTIVVFDSRAKTLWSLKWPRRCFQFLRRGEIMTVFPGCVVPERLIHDRILWRSFQR